ncbi:hypothetical protein [Facklamia sp. HMSC062C11]|nr:hypothetical protein [Facklamia sp. HMSC062C11]
MIELAREYFGRDIYVENIERQMREPILRGKDQELFYYQIKTNLTWFKN